MAADEVIADEATITGSIGVVALLPTAEGAMDKLGVRTGGVATTWLAGAYDPRRAFDPRLGQLVQSIIDRAYLDFTTLAAKARQTTPAKHRRSRPGPRVERPPGAGARPGRPQRRPA